ncbi:MAG TPA: MMPL family transporter [Myxococcaceae bacterium]|nr:MMPL family transporter [Myxococcaceae bacterium]
MRSSSPRTALRRALDQLIRWQLRHPVWVLGVVAALTAVSIALATRLRVETGFESLLPESRPSVVELRRVSARTATQSTIFVVLEGQDPAGIRRASDALVPALRALGPPWVGSVENGVHDALAFLRPRTGLYTDLATLKGLRDDVEARYAYEVGKQTGLQLGLEEAPPPPIAPDTVKSRLGVKAEDERRFPAEGRYQSADGKKAVVVIRSGVVGADFHKAEEAVTKVSEVVKRVNPASFDPAARWDLSGDLLIGLAEYRLINRDLTEVGLAGTVLILGIVFLYYLRVRTVISMGLAIGVGVAWTFALTELLIGRLNLATGFLFTIIAGNGINVSIILMARYLEERRRETPTEPAIVEAMRQTWRPTLTAAATASAAYGALVVTEFKGFREFGWIGGMGMLVCWGAAFLALPPMLLLMERFVPLERVSWWRRVLRVHGEGIPFGEPFARAVAAAPRTITVVGTVLAIAGAVLTVLYIRSDPMEYDTNKIQSDRSAVAEVHRLFHVASELTGFVGVDGMAVMTHRLDQVAPLKAALEARRDAAPPEAKPFKGVHTLQDFVPGDQEEKIPVLMQLRRRILKAHRMGLVPDWEKVEPYVPPDDLRPFGIDELPDAIARPYTEKDGTRGRIVFISPADGSDTADAHYLLRWADAYRSTVLPDGTEIRGSGRAVIYADMWSAILKDVPRAVAVSLLATLLIVAVSFRERRSMVRVILSLLVGVFWTVGILALWKFKLNFLNFIALPVTFGIGVDYAVNIVQRDLELRDPLEVLRRTGGAVVLCSLTTLLGYLALARSLNYGVRSLGITAVIGEAACLVAAVMWLPAALVWLRQRRAPEAVPTTGEAAAG